MFLSALTPLNISSNRCQSYTSTPTSSRPYHCITPTRLTVSSLRRRWLRIWCSSRAMRNLLRMVSPLCGETNVARARFGSSLRVVTSARGRRQWHRAHSNSLKHSNGNNSQTHRIRTCRNPIRCWSGHSLTSWKLYKQSTRTWRELHLIRPEGEHMARLCHGKFSGETKRLLRDDYERNGGCGNAWLSQPCDTCGKHVVAENKAGEWVPRTHEAPSRRRALKPGGYKR